LTTDGQATYGHAEKAGAWDIELGALDVASVRALEQTADDVAEVFVQAFAEIGTLEYAEGTVTEIGEDRRILSVQGEVPLVWHEGRFRPAPDADVGPEAGGAVLSSFMLVYTVTVNQAEQSVPVSSGLYFHYDSDLPDVVGQPATSRSAFARVDVEVDPWLDAPLHGGRFLDNRAIAALNRPRLERALRRWEAAMGKPIDHATSVPYPAFIDRYGFRPGGEPDPA
jgi:hypothetical protein